MVVDLQTNRAKIGTVRHAVGVDVVTIVCCVNFTAGLKTIGSVVFVGLLLMIAGIEPNPGPKEDVVRDSVTCAIMNNTDHPEKTEKETLPATFDNKNRHGGRNVKNTCISRSRETERKPAIAELEEDKGVSNSNTHTKVKVTGLPENIDEETLVAVFEDRKRLGGGKVTSVFFDKSNKTAIIEFEKPEAVTIILGKRPIKLAEKLISLDTLSDVDEGTIESATVKVTGLPCYIDEDMLGSIFEKKGAAQVRRVTIDKASCTADIEFETSEAIQVLMSKRPIVILGKEVTLELQSVNMLMTKPSTFTFGTPDKVENTEPPDESSNADQPNAKSGQPKEEIENNKETLQDPALNKSTSIAKSDVPHRGVEDNPEEKEPKTRLIKKLIEMIFEKTKHSGSAVQIELSMDETRELLLVLQKLQYNIYPEALYPTTESSDVPIVNVKVVDPAPSRATQKFVKALQFALEPQKIHLSMDETILKNELLPGSNLVMVVCNNHSRLEEDVKNSLSKIHENLLDRILLVVVHCKRRGKLSAVSSKETLEGKFGKIPEVVDIAFDETIYNCKMNTTALEMITRLKGRIDCKNSTNNGK